MNYLIMTDIALDEDWRKLEEEYERKSPQTLHLVAEKKFVSHQQRVADEQKRRHFLRRMGRKLEVVWK